MFSPKQYLKKHQQGNANMNISNIEFYYLELLGAIYPDMSVGEANKRLKHFKYCLGIGHE